MVFSRFPAVILCLVIASGCNNSSSSSTPASADASPNAKPAAKKKVATTAKSVAGSWVSSCVQDLVISSNLPAEYTKSVVTISEDGKIESVTQHFSDAACSGEATVLSDYRYVADGTFGEANKKVEGALDVDIAIKNVYLKPRSDKKVQAYGQFKTANKPECQSLVFQLNAETDFTNCIGVGTMYTLFKVNGLKLQMGGCTGACTTKETRASSLDVSVFVKVGK